MLRPRPAPAAAFAAVAILFVGNGLAVGVYGGSLPGLRAHLDLGAGRVVAILVTAGVCAVAAMNLAGPWADRRGARSPSFLGGGLMAVGVLGMGAAPTFPWLVAATAVFGLGNGAMDVAMNALGVGVERSRTRPVMSRLHACFSIGNLTGAMLVVTFGAWHAGAPPAWALWTGAVLLVVLLALATPGTPTGRTGASADPVAQGRGGRLWPAVAVLAAMAVCFGLTEGTAVDWSSLHVTDVAGVSPSTGAWGLASVSGFMVAIRLLGDAVVHRFGRARVVRGGALCALAGYLLTAAADALPVILLGWCLVGLGVGLVAPQIYGLAGHVGGGRGLAVVVSFGYAAFLVGPAIIGSVASLAGGGGEGIQRAMLVPMCAALGLVALSARMPRDPVAASV